jgi:peptidoglycan/LPS O-acetylase OafA/YrhL
MHVKNTQRPKSDAFSLLTSLDNNCHHRWRNRCWGCMSIDGLMDWTFAFLIAHFWIFAFLMGLFGYRRERWWIPAAAAGGFTAILSPWYYAHGGTVPFHRTSFTVFSLFFHLAIFYAAYGIGRGLARWRKGKA